MQGRNFVSLRYAARDLPLKDRRRGQAVMVLAVELPSGAAMVFAVAEHDPPLLSQVAAVESSEYLAKCSNGLSRVWSADSGTHSVFPPCGTSAAWSVPARS